MARLTDNQKALLHQLSRGNWAAFNTFPVQTRRSVNQHGWVESDACGCPVLTTLGRQVLAGLSEPTKWKREPDIYLEQIDSYGFMNFMERKVYGNFVYYAPRRIRLRGYNDGHDSIPRGIKQAREARRNWIAEQEAAGLVVKGVRSISKEMHYRLNADRFEVPVPIKDFESIGRTYHVNKGFILIQNHKLMVWDVVFGEEFGFVSMGTLDKAVRDGTIFEVFPRKDAPEI